MLEQRLAEINSKISSGASRSGRDASDITLVAVSKYVEIEKIHAALKAGHRVFGENYVQEGSKKRDLFLPVIG